VIVKFATTHVRDVVIRARRHLRESGDGPTVYVNEDLICRRAALAEKTRQLKKSRKINDCWIFNGKVILKTIDGVVKEIRSDVELKLLPPLVC
jgi:exosome complex exonuclease DIS3/RRP44